jgi:hypothetical protein
MAFGFAMAVYNRELEPVVNEIGASLLAGLSTVRLLMDLLAVSWFGTGMALSLRQPRLAPALTVLFVLILPSVLSFCLLDMFADIFFIFWGIARARRNLRQMVSQQYQH